MPGEEGVDAAADGSPRGACVDIEPPAQQHDVIHTRRAVRRAAQFLAVLVPQHNIGVGHAGPGQRRPAEYF